ncbi:TPA: hypothetical protein DDZ10_04090 [Candidatus Uhrbacteria bacterium]|uniref:Caib/baif family protein n=1 Tax=Candidatus Uhrbacteria bacterium GW2011_GWC2_53_7 TaxID=1618986 RepID=A0A0G1XZA1_9BACT|nr:MAG: hypothetical protein UY82_C0022G0005 [Candidatus Uhrbacteria bacterium GW2011_GWC2_53_7]HBL39819.1 hypothetical protein [Candidatus Uhrbacteria bacterium]
MNKTPNYDAKVRNLLDTVKSGEERTCSRTGEKWTVTEREIDWCRKFNVPVSSMSPLARWKTLGGHLFGYEWWWNKHAETGTPILTYVHPASGVNVLPDAEWLEKDFRSHARDFDMSQSFADQLLALRKEIPAKAFFNVKDPKNSIALISDGDVNSYFMIACKAKNSFYSSDLFEGELCTEIYAGKHITSSVNVVHAERIHNSRYIRESYDCSNSAFLFDCRNCEYCFGATNKRNKKYVWFNEQLTEDEYKVRMKDVDLGKRSEWQKWERKFLELMERDGAWPENFSEKIANCTGEYLTNCTNCEYCFMGWNGSKDNEHCFYLFASEGNYFVVGSFYPTRSYQCSSTSESDGCKFCVNVLRCQKLEYALNCQNCEDCFGCVGLNRQKFCIFNKQYMEEEYWKKLDEIKCAMLERGEYGDVLSGAFSTSHFLETGAQESLGVVEADAEPLGFKMFDRESAGAIGELGDVSELTNSSEVPDSIDDLDVDAWAGKPMFDEATGRKFAFLKPELNYYKQHRVAPPTKHFMRRVDELYWAANDFHLVDAACHKCSKSIQVAPNRTYKNRRHLCRSCYLAFLEKNG